MHFVSPRADGIAPHATAAAVPATAAMNPVLDSLRAIAVLLVLVSHIAETLRPVHPWDWRLGRLGVLLFFVHTACVLMPSLARTPGHGIHWAAHFYVRRAFRIYPLAVVCIAATVLFGVPWVAWQDGVVRDAGAIVANVFLVQNVTDHPSVLAPLWSLPLEVQMYLVLPVLYLATDAGKRDRPLAAVTAGAMVASIPFGFSGDNLIPFVPCFLFGIMLAGRLSIVQPRLSFAVGLGGLCVLIALYLGVSEVLGPGHSRIAAWTVCGLLGLALPLVKPPSRAWIRRASLTVATYSYGIYLAHIPILWLAFRIVDPGAGWLGWGVCVVGLCVIPVALFRLVEAPMIRLGARIAEHGLERLRAPQPAQL
jgi:peptidoglycan/LPS O-acetylase OafA/YrhL